MALPQRAEAGAEIVSGWPARVAGRSLAWLQNSFTRSESAPLRTKMHQDACSNCSFNDNCHPCRRPLSESSDVRSWRNCDRQRDAGSVRFQAAVSLTLNDRHWRPILLKKSDRLGWDHVRGGGADLFRLKRAPAAASGSAWPSCGGFGRWRRGGTRLWLRLGLAGAGGRASGCA